MGSVSIGGRGTSWSAAVRGTAVALAVAVVAGCHRAPSPPPPVGNAPTDSTATRPAAVAPTCGGATCRAGELCETRYKGHDVDDEGRPLDRTRCEPLPAPCAATPTCECLARERSFTSCTVDRGLVSTDDTPL